MHINANCNLDWCNITHPGRDRGAWRRGEQLRIDRNKREDFPMTSKVFEEETNDIKSWEHFVLCLKKFPTEQTRA